MEKSTERSNFCIFSQFRINRPLRIPTRSTRSMPEHKRRFCKNTVRFSFYEFKIGNFLGRDIKCRDRLHNERRVRILEKKQGGGPCDNCGTDHMSHVPELCEFECKRWKAPDSPCHGWGKHQKCCCPVHFMIFLSFHDFLVAVHQQSRRRSPMEQNRTEHGTESSNSQNHQSTKATASKPHAIRQHSALHRRK